MAKQRDLAERLGLPPAPEMGPAPAPAPLPPEASPAETPPDELAVLRAEVDKLRAELAESRQREGPAVPLSTAHAPGRYRVSLPGLRVRLASYTVEPREKAPEELRKLPAETYEGAELFGAGWSGDLQAAAWERYKHEHGVSDAVRRKFRVIPNPGGAVDALEVEALTEADAFAAFQRYNGILSSSRPPKIERVA